MKYDIFISYSRKDTEIIDRIEKELARYGITCFIDRSGINPGEDYAEVISKALFESELMLFIWSENSNQSKETANEVALAIDFEKPVIPFKIGKFQADYKLAYRLVRYNRIDALTYNEQKIIELGEKIAHQLGKKLICDTKSVPEHAEPATPAEPEYIEDPEIEADYRNALNLLKDYKIREAFDTLYALALIEYKDSVDLMRYFTAAATGWLDQLSQEQTEKLRQDAENGLLLAKTLYSHLLRRLGNNLSFQYAKEAVEEGYLPAKLSLAKCYDLGIGTPTDNGMASRLMIEAMEEGDLAAKEEYIRYLYHGYNFKEDKAKAIRMCEELESQNNIIAAKMLAGIYSEINHWDTDKAAAYAEKAIDGGIKESYYDLAIIKSCNKYLTIVDQGKYVEYLMKGAEYNEPSCISSLATAYYYGQGVQQNIKHAERWAKRGASAGDRWSMYILNQIYYYGGEGIAEDEEEAWKWAKMGADRCHIQCVTALGNMCRDGYGFEGNENEDCIKFYERAVYLGNAKAIDAGIELYKIYADGKFGKKKDIRKAASYIKPIAEEKYGPACLIYGKLLTDINCELCDEFLGVKYLKIACEIGESEAFYILGNLYETGFGVPKDLNKAKEMKDKAIELGYEEPESSVTETEDDDEFDRLLDEFIAKQLNDANQIEN